MNLIWNSRGIILSCLLVLLMAACAIETPAIHHRGMTQHIYRINVTDVNGKAMAGVSVTSTLYDHSRRVIDSVLTTGESGEAAFVCPATVDSGDYYNDAFESKCEYSVYKSGYLPQYGNASITYVFSGLNERSDKGMNEYTKTIQLLKISDLFDPALAATADTALEKHLEKYVEDLYRSNADKGIVIPPYSVSTQLREGRHDLSITLQTPNVLNTDVLDDGRIVRTLFELAGRPALEMLRDRLNQFTQIDDLALTIKGKKKSFTKPGEEGVAVQCAYLVPKTLFQSVDSLGQNSQFLAGARTMIDGRVIALEK